jgi:hypothetical protein
MDKHSRNYCLEQAKGLLLSGKKEGRIFRNLVKLVMVSNRIYSRKYIDKPKPA